MTEEDKIKMDGLKNPKKRNIPSQMKQENTSFENKTLENDQIPPTIIEKGPDSYEEKLIENKKSVTKNFEKAIVSDEDKPLEKKKSTKTTKKTTKK
jgi:hypothetical protein